MSVFKANQWQKSDGTVYGAVVNMEQILIGYCVAGIPSSISSYYTISDYNVRPASGNLFTTTYTPVIKKSTVVYQFLLDVDAGSLAANTYEQVWVFINDAPLPSAAAQTYRRNQGHEPHHKSISGSVSNVGGGPIKIELRVTNNTGSGYITIGSAGGGNDASMSATLNIIEVQA